MSLVDKGSSSARLVRETAGDGGRTTWANAPGDQTGAHIPGKGG